VSPITTCFNENLYYVLRNPRVLVCSKTDTNLVQGSVYNSYFSAIQNSSAYISVILKSYLGSKFSGNNAITFIMFMHLPSAPLVP
jgi:hypothetical protein